MSRAYLAFTDRGMALAERLAEALPGSVSRCGKGGVPLAEWTARQFAESEALIFVGAAGIAVRAIAPYCRSKAEDPAVVVLDERGTFVIPLLSGHLGGANTLARQLAAICGATPVITTATDVNEVFAVDEWAVRQGCAVLETGRIKRVSGKLLAGGTAAYWSEFPVRGILPAGITAARTQEEADFALTSFPQGEVLHLVPEIGILGIGCRRGTPVEQLEVVFTEFCARSGLAPEGICGAASIDLKQDEDGLRQFCKTHGWNVCFYTADELRNVPGQFTQSAFVRSVTGVDNVCERAAVRASGGELRLKKYAASGVTFALAQKPYFPDWRWQDAGEAE